MADFLITTLCVAIALAGALSLADSWIAGRHAFATLMSERLLAREGFGPPLPCQDARLRRTGTISSHRGGRLPVRASSRDRLQPRRALGAA